MLEENKFCIAMMFQNEENWLRLHLPILAQAGFGFVFVDGGSDDGSTQVAEQYGPVVYNEYRWPTIHQHNKLIEVAEQHGYDAMVKIDPDELFFIDHIRQMRELLNDYVVLRFPTYHFIRDRQHYNPFGHYYPDSHDRAWRLNIGLNYVGEYHSRLNWAERYFKEANGENDENDELVLDAWHIHLYHYGDIKDRAARHLRSLNITRAKAGQSPLVRLPAGKQITYPPSIPFVGPHPISPHDEHVIAFDNDLKRRTAENWERIRPLERAAT